MVGASGRDEVDTCRDVVLPALARAGWTDAAIRPEYVVNERLARLAGDRHRFGDGRVDYVLEAVPGVPTAVVEAKREYLRAADGMQQAIRYAQQLDVPLAYATNGHRTLERDMVAGTEREVESVATPAETWSAWQGMHGLADEGAGLVARPFNRRKLTAHNDVVEPRYYQRVAIHRVLRALATGERRVLLLMATGTGKTFTAMQIVHKLRAHHAALHPDTNHRTLYLADRDALLVQPMAKDFTPAFGAGPLRRILGPYDRSREVYFGTYQALAADDAFQDFAPDFFDFVVVDECHRGSASEESSWRRVLDHFSGAAQLGLTATPIRGDTIDSYAYFGNPVFEYSLRDGIEDGYLAPYRVRRVVLSPDADGWEPGEGERDRFGREIPEGIYGTRDFERVVSLLARTKLAVRHLSDLLRRDPDPGARALVFCVDVEHADDVRRALVDENPDRVAALPEWAVRIVGVDGEKARLLEDFTDPDSVSPIVVTTSCLLATGVDVPDLKYVVLFRPVGSMVEFKQIIGRGTRLYPDKGKTSFEIVDYVGATAMFSDPDFDGYPAHVTTEQVDAHGAVVERAEVEPDGVEKDAAEPDEVVREPMPESPTQLGGAFDGPEADLAHPRRKLYVDDGHAEVVAEALQVPDRSSGRLVLTEYGQHVVNVIQDLGSPAELTATWAAAATRRRLLVELAAHGVSPVELVAGAGGADVDLLDILLQVAWNQPAPTRAERAHRVRAQHGAEIEAHTELARRVLQAVLDRYVTNGVEDVASGQVLELDPLRTWGSPVQLAREFGGSREWNNELDRLQQWLYSA